MITEIKCYEDAIKKFPHLSELSAGVAADLLSGLMISMLTKDMDIVHALGEVIKEKR